MRTRACSSSTAALAALFAAGLLATRPAHGAGSFDVCREPANHSSARAAYDMFAERNLAGGNLGRDNWSADLMFARDGKWLMGGAYRGTLLDDSGIGFQTNGYLHGFYFVLHRLRDGDRRLRWAMAPALSGSSNVTKDPDQYDTDAWQFNFAAVWDWPGGSEYHWRAGICADHRFGRYRAYPVLGIAWQPGDDWRVEAGFPDTRISYRTGDAMSATFAIYPNGNEWYVKDKSLERASMFEYRAWSAELSLTWNLSAAIALTATGGADFDAEYRADLMDNSRPTLDAGTVGRIGLELSARF